MWAEIVRLRLRSIVGWDSREIHTYSNIYMCHGSVVKCITVADTNEPKKKKTTDDATTTGTEW